MSGPIRSAVSKVSSRASAIGAKPAPADDARSGGTPQEDRRDVQHGVVDQAVPNQSSTRGWRPLRRAPPGRLASRGAAGARPATRRRRRRARGPRRRLPPRSTPRTRRFGREIGRGHQRRSGPVEQTASGRHTSRGVDHDAQRRTRRRRSAHHAPSARGRRRSPSPRPRRSASAQARSRCTSARDASPVIHREEPSVAAVLPSRLDAIFSVTNGRPLVTWRSNARLRRRDSAASTPCSTSMPGVAELREAGRVVAQVRIGRRRPPRAPPRRRSAPRVQGGVRPKWLHGSSVQTTVAPLARGLRCGAAPSPRRARCRALRASPRRAPSRRDHRRRGRPPWGWETRGPSRARRARSARRICDSVVLSPRAASFGPAEAWRMAGVRRCDSRRAHSAAGRRVHPFPSIPTLTVGPGVPPGPPTAGVRQGRGLSPPVGSCTPPRKRWFLPAVYGATGAIPLAGVSPDLRGALVDGEAAPPSRLANCFISVATATASP